MKSTEPLKVAFESIHDVNAYLRFTFCLNTVNESLNYCTLTEPSIYLILFRWCMTFILKCRSSWKIPHVISLHIVVSGGTERQIVLPESPNKTCVIA